MMVRGESHSRYTISNTVDIITTKNPPSSTTSITNTGLNNHKLMEERTRAILEARANDSSLQFYGDQLQV